MKQPPLSLMTGLIAIAILPTAFAQTATRTFGGPEGVTQRLETDANPDAVLPRVSPLQPYFDWKGRLQADHGVSFGLSAIMLYQVADEVLPESQDDAFGGVYRFSGSWTAFARDSGHPGRIEWRVENRSNVGSSQAPNTLSGAVGAAALNTGFGYSESFDTDLAVFNWTQLFADQRGGVAIGRLAFDVYLDPYAFQTFSRAFLNRAFILNPTMATTGIGALGGVAKGFVTDNVWIGGQVYDANAASGDFDWDTIEESEWFGAFEMGWAPAIDRYKTDRVQLTYWSKDERAKAEVEKGEGLALTASCLVAERWLPFVRYGHSDGGAGVPAVDALSMGFEYAVRADQHFALGAGWAKPSGKTFEGDLRDEYVIEASYRFQVTPSISLTPDLQLLIDPAQHPEEDRVWVAGVRGIVNL
jgi:porin